MIQALAAAVWLSASAASAAPVDEVIAAERAFAADAAARGTKAAFADNAAGHGVLVRKGRAVNARAFIASWPDAKDTELRWWPIVAGASQAGDLGFTTGPAVYGRDEGFTHFFTVWEKQADGRWRWLIDMGAKTPVKSPFGPETPVRIVPAAAAAGPDAAVAFEEVRALDAALAEAARSDYPAAHAARLADDARVFGLEPVPAEGAAVRAALAARPKRIAMRMLGGGAAKAGDLAYTYGVADVPVGETARRGQYLRVWQRRPEGWRIVVDLISTG